jgi:predicted RNA-binding Zn-ribbon protein involved in translation (DUF1610 family)
VPIFAGLEGAGRIVCLLSTLEVCPSMPSRRKISLEKIKASLFTLCTQCGYKIEPAERHHVDKEHLRCPKCGAAFIPGKAK